MDNCQSIAFLQIPYFWSSHIGTADNVEYGESDDERGGGEVGYALWIRAMHSSNSAIYLNKRLMRNEEKHGLETHEVEAYNKLMELLGHMWDFITVQAEMQLKLHKEKKKSDKVVLDSQERAFWRIQRPQVCTLSFILSPPSIYSYSHCA